ncbi:hypothetical protein RRH01S_16_00590 [Rhizobium rhizogenes NBRC 13257]|uniref:Uncharacterized protein n=1 Tax=Rhizobium rhizogenes NBRC 13257 TaxID=1220581 RepID=A0AA87QDD9_RHIRH|nr:hypothetical protein RRH01S_16_00590 [Rhizobium rhizogenes NBRC 13257]
MAIQIEYDQHSSRVATHKSISSPSIVGSYSPRDMCCSLPPQSQQGIALKVMTDTETAVRGRETLTGIKPLAAEYYRLTRKLRA